MKILSRPRGNAEEYGRWSVNPYVGCPHGCSYCYLKKGVWAKELGGNVPRLKKGIVNEEHAFHLAMVEILENKEQIIKDGGLFMSFITDPFAEGTKNLFFSILDACVHYKIPATVLTKAGSDSCFRSFKDEEGNNMAFTLLSKLITLDPEYVSIGWTLTGHDELEPHASTNESRIELMKRLNDYPYHNIEDGSIVNPRKTWASIEPVIDFQSSYRMVCQALRAGCQHFKIGLLTSNTKPCREKYNVHDCLDFIEKVVVTTEGKATVYWKQSVRDYIRTSRKPALTDDELHKVFDTREHSVDSHWSMFK